MDQFADRILIWLSKNKSNHEAFNWAAVVFFDLSNVFFYCLHCFEVKLQIFGEVYGINYNLICDYFIWLLLISKMIAGRYVPR